MKIILIGASGTIGKHVYSELSRRHQITSVGKTSGDIQADISSVDSIKAMYDKAGGFDAVVCTAGSGYFGPFDDMYDEQFRTGINSKLMGQVNLVLEGRNYINDNGSFTLTTGILSDDPVAMASNLSTVNGAVNAFVKAVSYELKRGIRINSVSPGVVEDSKDTYGPYFPGHIPVAMQRAVSGYVKNVEGIITGEIIKLY